MSIVFIAFVYSSDFIIYQINLIWNLQVVHTTIKLYTTGVHKVWTILLYQFHNFFVKRINA